MSGWLLILALLVLGGVLATLGDRLGSRIGKARLSLFNLRPRRTAVVITVLTGSLISAVSLGLMLLVSQRLRVGLFELDQLQGRLASTRRELTGARREQAEAGKALELARQELSQERGELKQARRDRREALSQSRTLRSELAPLKAERAGLERDIAARDADIQRREKELEQLRGRIQRGERDLEALESNLIALRRGDVVISSGQPLITATLRLDTPDQSGDTITRLLQEANQEAFRRVRPGEDPSRQIVLVPRADISRLESIIREPGTWVVSILSAGNVLRGETTVYAYPDVRPNRIISESGEVMASTSVGPEERSLQQVRDRLNLLLASTLATAQRRGSIASGVQFDVGQANALLERLQQREVGALRLEAVSRRQIGVADPISVDLRLTELPG
ncbi:DUF3084 domain-containing protein [Synechococcus sp. RSCCF101]|uniref:DUF3084 domain-containing protein n=1 Tax=Synechococcus sp. RSCCF101 TaxID=2511069 RepID=UPI001243F750|nr:DUF3084 domain-containing protein [Synechococcus sp. RSCCF101]QEY32264.1 DUF3084 domain-containing protein [Synechococcus sp. RSCCF101]